MWPQTSSSADRHGQALETIRKAQFALDQLRKTQSSGTRRGKLHEQIGDARRAMIQPKAAQEAYRLSLAAFSCAGDEKNRSRLIRKLSGNLLDWPRSYRAKYKKLLHAWNKIRLLYKRAAKFPRRLQAPEDIDANTFQITQDAIKLAELAKSHQDQELLAWARELEGRALAAAGYPSEELSKYIEAADACGQSACPKKRNALLIKAASIVEERNKLVKAYELYALVNAEASSDLSIAQRHYARSPDLIRVCDKLRSIGNSFSCMKLEQKATGFATFRDFSSDPPKDKLSHSQIQMVHDEYLALLTACLRQALENGEIETGELIELSWTVLNNGRTDRMACYPSTEGLELDSCLQQALAIFRYPRYRGERQNVTLPLSVDTR